MFSVTGPASKLPFQSKDVLKETCSSEKLHGVGDYGEKQFAKRRTIQGMYSR